MGTTAAIALAIQLLPLIQTGVVQFIAYIEALKSAAQQSGEWTPAMDASWRSALFAKTNDPKYQPDAA